MSSHVNEVPINETSPVPRKMRSAWYRFGALMLKRATCTKDVMPLVMTAQAARQCHAKYVASQQGRSSAHGNARVAAARLGAAACQVTMQSRTAKHSCRHQKATVRTRRADEVLLQLGVLLVLHYRLWL